jgi:hypothetical protein
MAGSDWSLTSSMNHGKNFISRNSSKNSILHGRRKPLEKSMLHWSVMAFAALIHSFWQIPMLLTTPAQETANRQGTWCDNDKEGNSTAPDGQDPEWPSNADDLRDYWWVMVLFQKTQWKCQKRNWGQNTYWPEIRELSSFKMSTFSISGILFQLHWGRDRSQISRFSGFGTVLRSDRCAKPEFGP